MLNTSSNQKSDQEEIIEKINKYIEKHMNPSNDKTSKMFIYEFITMNKNEIKLKLFSNSVKDLFTGISIFIVASSFSYWLVMTHIENRNDIRYQRERVELERKERISTRDELESRIESRIESKIEKLLDDRNRKIMTEELSKIVAY